MTSVALPAKVNPNVDATFEDALFMVVVRSKDSEDASDTLPTFQAVMPADSVVACDARGGLAARRPSSVQLLTRDRVSIALYSSTLDAAAVVDGFVSRRDAHRDDPGRVRTPCACSSATSRTRATASPSPRSTSPAALWPRGPRDRPR